MKIVIILLTFFLAGCSFAEPTEARARELAHIEFNKTCAKLRLDASSYKDATPANIRGGDVIYSYLWYPKERGKIITVIVEKSGWTEAGMGPDYENGKLVLK